MYLLSLLLTPISECERNDLLEVIQSRTDKKSTFTAVNGPLKDG